MGRAGEGGGRERDGRGVERAQMYRCADARTMVRAEAC